MRVALYTLGCKLNQYETELIREGFEKRGYQVVGFDQEADVYIVNSCTVTKRADHDTRRLLRQAKRRNPDALVIAAGCYAQTDAEALHAMPEVDLVLGNKEKANAAATVEAMNWLEGRQSHRHLPYVSNILAEREFDTASVATFAGHTRAFVKIQDGCDARCAYCKVPFARGPNRSRPFDDAVIQVRRLCEVGYREIVLIGVHLGTYGRDLSPRTSLAELLRATLSVDVPERLRLSSIEPLEFTPDLIDVLASNTDRICRHLHIPLQSGSDAVLARMQRSYTAAKYAELIRELADRIAGNALGADVLVGFPGESDDDFASTRDLIMGLPLAYLHVFSYSKREGTAAAHMANPVRPDIIKKRSRELIELSEKKRRSFLEGLIGTTQRVLFERRHGDMVAGLTDTYAKVEVPSDNDMRNMIHDVTIEGTDGERCFGRQAKSAEL